MLTIVNVCAYAQHSAPYVFVLGIAQDGGHPHIGCEKQCCKQAWEDVAKRHHVVSLALVDPATKQWWLLEATPDIKDQLHIFHEQTRGQYSYLPSGIFITHAHIGHYAGLMELGREALNSNNVPVYALPKMQAYLSANGPWSQLVALHNINQIVLKADSTLVLNEHISITTFTVPHRDEYSETAGFNITAGDRKYLFIPDINKWDKWSHNIITAVKGVDVALLDATFNDDTELPGRKMSEIPHPFILETMQLFDHEDAQVKAKVHFIHFNHTNSVMWNRKQKEAVIKAGFSVAEEGEQL